MSKSAHRYTETLVTFEYTSSATRQPHSLLFVGGLGDGLATTSYRVGLVYALQSTEWSLFFTLNLTSSYQSWVLGHLDGDTNEIAECVRHIKYYKTSKAAAARLSSWAISQEVNAWCITCLGRILTREHRKLILYSSTLSDCRSIEQ